VGGTDIPKAPTAARTGQRRMNRTEIEFAVRDLIAKPYDPSTFPFDFLTIYNAPAVTISKLKSGQINGSSVPGDVLWKKRLFFRRTLPGDNVGVIGDALVDDPLTVKHKPRFIVVTDGLHVFAQDLELKESIDPDFRQLDANAEFFFPLAGYERRAIAEEHPADIKAAKNLTKLHDAILATNPTWTGGHFTRELNLLMTRLLFCFYAEDTGIFDTPQLFTQTLAFTSEDGSDVAPLLDRLFRVMNTKTDERCADTPKFEMKFPFVNGSLFEANVAVPTFTRMTRRQLLECGGLDWKTISPDIFGSMIQM
jgi:hypothetical protein